MIEYYSDTGTYVAKQELFGWKVSQLYEIEHKKQMEQRDDIEAGKMKIEWGSQIRNYVMHPYKLVKDVRTAHETGNVDAVMNGEIEPFLKSYLMMMGQKTEDKKTL